MRRIPNDMILCRLAERFVSPNTLLFFSLHPCAFGLPLVPGRSCRDTLFLERQARRFRGFLSGLVGFEESGFCLGGGSLTTREIVVIMFSHSTFPKITWFYDRQPSRRHP
jgi:hypothetical protein